SGAAAPGLTAAGAGATAASASAAIRIALLAAVMAIDDEAALHPDVRDASGAALSPLALSWETLDPEVARVDADGRVRALRIGQARIVARAGTAMATLQLTVTRAGVRTLAIGMPPGALEVGERVLLKLVTGEAPGALPHPRLADWRTSDPRVATVDAAGRVTAHAEGGVEVTARTGGATAVASLRVTKAFISAVEVVAPAPRLSTGMRVQLDARPANTKGHPLEGLPVRWEVSDPGIAVVSPEGVLTAKRSGQVLVAARVGGRVGTARLTVVAG
ncbi:MAG: Ig-like domain-containing protein, partial [Gemmatimonadaceae bacterium]|nr:Ig-like domain-containing protein [Gemmatimonadaceae bacterium]